jgi:hypothetical protein
MFLQMNQISPNEQGLYDYLENLIVSQSDCRMDLGEYFNTCLEILMQILDTLNFGIDKLDARQHVKVNKIVLIMKNLTVDFTCSVSGFSYTDLKSSLYLLSVLVTVEDENLKGLVDFMKTILLENYSIEFDRAFIMMHQLHDFERCVYEIILNESSSKSTCSPTDILILEITSKKLQNIRFISSVLKMLDRIVVFDGAHQRLKNLFWSMYNDLGFHARLDLIGKVYEAEDLNRSEDGSIKCLFEKDFKRNLLILINQLSSQNTDDTKVCRCFPVFDLLSKPNIQIFCLQ